MAVPVEQSVISFFDNCCLSEILFLHREIAQIGNQDIIDPVLDRSVDAYDLQMIGIRFFDLCFIDELLCLIGFPAPELRFMASGIHIDRIAFFAVFGILETEQQSGSSLIVVIGKISFVDEVLPFHFGNKERIALTNRIGG